MSKLNELGDEFNGHILTIGKTIAKLPESGERAMAFHCLGQLCKTHAKIVREMSPALYGKMLFEDPQMAKELFEDETIN